MSRARQMATSHLLCSAEGDIALFFRTYAIDSADHDLTKCAYVAILYAIYSDLSYSRPLCSISRTSLLVYASRRGRRGEAVLLSASTAHHGRSSRHCRCENSFCIYKRIAKPKQPWYVRVTRPPSLHLVVMVRHDVR